MLVPDRGLGMRVGMGVDEVTVAMGVLMRERVLVWVISFGAGLMLMSIQPISRTI